MMVVQPTEALAETFSTDRLAPMVRDTPALRGKIRDPRSRDSGNKILYKRFPGGHITLVGANSPVGLASRPIRILLLDEVDRYPFSAGTEGDPVNLAKKRTVTFWNRKVALFSTPTRKGASRIDAAYEASDKRRYLVPCPDCGHYHALEWANIRYPEGDPLAAQMVCPECGTLYGDDAKPRMLARGRWVASEKFRGVAGFHVSELYSPWRTFGEIAKDYEAAKDSPEQLKVFTNTSLGETFEEKGEAPEWQRLFERRERWPSNRIPADVAILTAGVDVQGDRIEVEITGWAKRKRPYLIDYRVFLGDTANLDDPDGPWAKLQDMIGTESWETEAGPQMGLRYTAIDSGYRTTTVYEFCKRFSLTRVAPIKGVEHQVTPISSPKSITWRRNGKPVRGTKLYTVGVSILKSELYGWLRLNKAEDGTPPPGYCHFNEDRDAEYFKGLTSEQVQTKVDRGVQKEVWVRDPSVRNEALDCRIYSRAAAAIAGMDRWVRDKDWDALMANRGAAAPKRADSVAPEAPAPEPARQERRPAAPKIRRASFWDR